MKRPPIKRLLIISLSVFFLFSILIYQFFHIQISEGDKWSGLAKKQHFFSIKEPFMRGTFYSNNLTKDGNPSDPQKIVFDIQKYHLYADPLSIPEAHRAWITKTLTEKLELPPKESGNLQSQFTKKSRSRKLAMWISIQKRDEIISWWNGYARQNKIPRNALYFISDYQRSYPFDRLLGQILHTVQQNKDAVTQQAIPTGGLELFFNEYLKGKPGKRVLMRSPRRSFETGLVISEPENGADIYLTIDCTLQAIAEEELEKGIKKSKAQTGWAVMMEPSTGEILALAQYPFFNPAKYQEYFNNPELIEHTKVKAITDANEPGSVMKALTLGLALKANEELKAKGESPIFRPEEVIDVRDGHFPGRSKALAEPARNKKVNMWMAVQTSSNRYFARLTERIIKRLGDEWYRRTLQEIFGLGLKTNIELPSESEGLLPRPGKLHPNGTLEWSTPTPYSLCIGHNLQMTAVQLARAYSVLANGGKLVNPTIIKKIVKTNREGEQIVLVDHTGAERKDHFPRTLNPDIVSEVVKAMKYVTKPGGTSRRGEIWGYTEVGKSGTAEKVINGKYSKTRHVVDFAGFTPVANPAFVLVVVVDDPEYRFIPGVGKNHSGGVCAAPIFRDIALRSLEYLGIPPDDPHGYPKGDPRYDPRLADWIPETLLLSELFDKLNK